MPPPMTPAPSTPIRFIATRESRFRELDTREPETGRFELGRGREQFLARPEPVQSFETSVRAFDHTPAERDAGVVVPPIELQAEQAIDERRRAPAFEPMSRESFIDLRVRRDHPFAE